MTERRMCDPCGIRPAVTAVRCIGPARRARIEHLCEVHAAQAIGGRSPCRRGGSFFNSLLEEESRRIPIPLLRFREVVPSGTGYTDLV
jgi:ATP-dependent Clp protease ATP-binding subunit ClpC